MAIPKPESGQVLIQHTQRGWYNTAKEGFVSGTGGYQVVDYDQAVKADGRKPVEVPAPEMAEKPPVGEPTLQARFQLGEKLSITDLRVLAAELGMDSTGKATELQKLLKEKLAT